MTKYDLSKVTRKQLESVVELVLNAESRAMLNKAVKDLKATPIEPPKPVPPSNGTPWDPVAAHRDMHPDSWLTAKDFNPNS